MSGGRLVVLDRAGRDVKRFPLAEGLATLGSDPACDIRIMLPTVSPHHATVVVHTNQTVVRNVCEDDTLVNGRCVSVAALRHGDVISIGGRHLRWEYTDPTVRRPQAPEPALYVRGRARRGARRGSGPAGGARDPALRLAIEMTHRASMPGSAGGKQVAIVQPQRRDTSDQIDKNPPRTPLQASKRPRISKSDVDTSIYDAENEKTKRKSNPRVSPKNSLSNLQNTTKATLWIESRKTSPRKLNKIQTPTQEQVLRARRTTASAKKSTPLRLTVLKRAQSAQKMKVTKIEGPLKMDHTKQAAIRLMTGHTPKSKLSSVSPSSGARSASLVVKKPSPLRRTTPRSRNTRATPTNSTVSILEITDSDGRNSSLQNSRATRRSGQKTPKKSLATSPRKSALKDPSAKRGTRKTESIKFDLSNLHNHSQDADILMVTDTTKQSYGVDSTSEDDITLHYSESSGVQSPSPRRSIHSRSSKILQHTLRTTLNVSPRLTRSSRHTLTPSYSRRTTKSVSDTSQNVTVASAYTTRTVSPRTLRNDLESYSIVDLVSIDTDDTARSTSIYGSADSNDVTAFGTPQNSTGRKTRSTIDPTLLGSSTPYVKGRSSTPRSRSNPSLNTSSKTSMNRTKSTTKSSRSRRSKSLLTPENTEDARKHISVHSTRISRASRSRSRLNDSDLLLLDDDDDSPRTSKRVNTISKSTRFSAKTAGNTDVISTQSSAQNEGTCTPENKYSPEEASTPVLSIQSLLDSSQSSLASQRPQRKSRPSFNTKRKTIGGVTGPKTRIGAKSKSMSFSARKTRLRLSSDSVEIVHHNDDSEVVTPKSAVKLVQEGVKNKHSTAKKPQSKRSIIDDLNESDIVKQLFNSPVKRKLSQSMTEFSRKKLFEDDDIVQDKRPTRNTIALTGRTPDNSMLDHTESYTPEIFVSPISTPTRSPSLEGIKLMFAKTTPENDLRNVRGVKRLLRTPRTRRSIKNDLTNVSGVKNIFTKSPKNRLSDVRVRDVFASSPNNDLRRVTGVKSLFRTTEKRKSPRNELDDVRGVKKLFKTKSPVNDLRNVSGVKRTLRRNSPRNDLSDVRGVKRMFRREKRDDLNDVSGVEELFNLSSYSSATVSTRAESLFDQLVGKPQRKAVYSKTFTTKTVHKTKQSPRTKSLHASLDQITGTENWLEQELNKRLQIKNYLESLKSTNNSKVNRSNTNKSKSPHASLDEVTGVDILLEQELNKEQQINNYFESMRSVNDSKANKSKANKSKVNQSRANKSKTFTSKANMSRELQKLVTETVEGDAPIRTSRVRNSTMLRSNESDLDRKKSTSELYSAHTLPIKKRSLVSVSEQSRVLPIKKRVVQHSTPMKGCVHLTLDASALGRVSPIAALHTDRDISIRTTQPKAMNEVRPKSTRSTKANTENVEIENTPEFVKPSPKKTRGRAKVVSPKAKPASPPNEKAHTKTKKASPAKVKTASSAKAKKTSSAKSKKATLIKVTTPVKKVSPVKAKTPSPAKMLAGPVPVKTTRSHRKDILILESNTKKRGATVVVAKKSPLKSPKPRASRKRKEPEISPTPKPSPKKTRATRKNESVKDDKPMLLKNTRARVQKATVVISKPSPQLKPRMAKRRQADQSEQETTRKMRKTVAVQDKQPESPKKSQSSSKTRAAEVLPKTRGRKAVVHESKENTVVYETEAKIKKGRKTDEPSNKKTRNNKQEKSIEEPKPVRTRGKKVDIQESVESKPRSTRGRRTEPDSTAPEVTTRKRKSSAPDSDIPPKVRKSKVADRGRKRDTEVNTEIGNTRKKSVVKEGKVKKAQSDAPVKTTRGRKAAEVEPVKTTKEPEQKTIRGRGRKANIENVPANQETGKRKRATAAEPSPAQERSKKQRGGKKSGIATSPVKQTRVTRRNTQPEGKSAGRSRRR